MPHLEIENVSASYGETRALDGVSMHVDRGEVVSLIGPSRSGKSTLLRLLMGLTSPTSGTVRLDGEAIDFSSKASVRQARARMAIVFQQYNLFQNMTVLQNVALAPTEVQKRTSNEVHETAVQALHKVGLQQKLDAYPPELSGGQQRRVAIARALALKPELLLLDEVTAALDPELVQEVLGTVRGLAHNGMTLLIVSHEMSFVREVSDRVVMMDGGRIVETGTPEEIFGAPTAARTREFVGSQRIPTCTSERDHAEVSPASMDVPILSASESGRS